MKNEFFCLLALSALLAGCSGLADPDAPGAGKTRLTVSLGGTRTVLGPLEEGRRQLYWADGDQVAVNGSVSDALSGVPASSVSATFTFGSSLEAPYDAVYPASIVGDGPFVTLPLYAGDGVMPLGGRSMDSSLLLCPLMSCVRISLLQDQADTDRIRYVEVSSATTRMSGKFGIDYDAASLTPYDNPSGDDLKVRVVGSWDLSADTPVDIFVPVPAGSYQFTVKVVDVKGHFMKVTTSASKTMEKGIIKAFPAVTFIPTGTEFEVVITS